MLCHFVVYIVQVRKGFKTPLDRVESHVRVNVKVGQNTRP